MDLLATLDLGARALQTQQQGVTVAGRNLANVNNPAYARQRLLLQTAPTVTTSSGTDGTGVQSSSVVQLRNQLVDRQIQTEASVRGALQSRQEALQLLQTDLRQVIDRNATTSEASGAGQSDGGQHGIAQNLSDLFNSFQSLSTDPGSSAERQSVIGAATQLAARFNQVDSRLTQLRQGLNDAVEQDVGKVNGLLSGIAQLNQQIGQADTNGTDTNQLRDARQEKLEALGGLVSFQSGVDSTGQVHITIGGSTMVSNAGLENTLETYDLGGGQMMVRGQTAGLPLSLSGGSLQGTIDARDGELATTQASLNALAAQLISSVNAVHRAGFSQTESTGADFFSGSNAADIRVNQALLDNPAAVQAAGTAGAAGDNQIALQLAQLQNQAQSALQGQTFQQQFACLVTNVGSSMAAVNGQLSDQSLVDNMLQSQRDSVSGVSVDEEMTDLVRFQRAFEASARLITTVDDMLQTIVNMGQ